MPEVAGDAACLVDPFDSASIRRGVVKVIDVPAAAAGAHARVIADPESRRAVCFLQAAPAS